MPAWLGQTASQSMGWDLAISITPIAASKADQQDGKVQPDCTTGANNKHAVHLPCSIAGRDSLKTIWLALCQLFNDAYGCIQGDEDGQVQIDASKRVSNHHDV